MCVAGMEVFLKGASFHGVMLDNIFTAPIDMRRSLYNLMCEGLKSGAVQPLTRIVFPAKEVEQAFRCVRLVSVFGSLRLEPE